MVSTIELSKHAERALAQIELWPGVPLTNLMAGTARVQVHEALRELEEAGLIEVRLVRTDHRPITKYYPKGQAPESELLRTKEDEVADKVYRWIRTNPGQPGSNCLMTSFKRSIVEEALARLEQEGRIYSRPKFLHGERSVKTYYVAEEEAVA